MSCTSFMFRKCPLDEFDINYSYGTAFSIQSETLQLGEWHIVTSVTLGTATEYEIIPYWYWEVLTWDMVGSPPRCPYPMSGPYVALDFTGANLDFTTDMTAPVAGLVCQWVLALQVYANGSIEIATHGDLIVPP